MPKTAEKPKVNALKFTLMPILQPKIAAANRTATPKAAFVIIENKGRR